MSGYGAFDDYMSASNKSKCSTLVTLVVQLHRVFDDDSDSVGFDTTIARSFTSAIASSQVPKHVRGCPACKEHPLLKGRF